MLPLAWRFRDSRRSRWEKRIGPHHAETVEHFLCLALVFRSIDRKELGRVGDRLETQPDFIVGACSPRNLDASLESLEPVLGVLEVDQGDTSEPVKKGLLGSRPGAFFRRS